MNSVIDILGVWKKSGLVKLFLFIIRNFVGIDSKDYWKVGEKQEKVRASGETY